MLYFFKFFDHTAKTPANLTRRLSTALKLSLPNLGSYICLMIKISSLSFVFLMCFACGGSLSDEQRKRIRESMEDGQIRRVPEAELTEAAYQLGRQLMKQLEKSEMSPASIDSLQKVYNIKIGTLQTTDSVMLEIEKQIIEAYTTGSGNVELTDNIQKLGADSLLYTKPILKELPDGTMRFEKAVGIHMPRKTVVRSIPE
jgi:hypothetical protein